MICLIISTFNQDQLPHVSISNIYTGDVIASIEDNRSFLSLASTLNIGFADHSKGFGAISTCKDSSAAIICRGFKILPRCVFNHHARDSEAKC